MLAYQLLEHYQPQVGTFHSLNHLSFIIYALQTNMYPNAAKFLNHRSPSKRETRNFLYLELYMNSIEKYWNMISTWHFW